MFKKHLRSDFLKNLITLVSGTAVAQALSLLVSPLLSRYYSPEDFTIFALFNSTSAILSVVATARFELAVPLPKLDKDARAVLKLSVLISLSVAAISFLGIVVFRLLSSDFDSANWFYLIPISVLVNGLYNAFNYWSTRQKTFKINALGRVVMSVGMATTGVLLGYLTGEAYGLILGLVVGQVLGTLVMIWPWISNRRTFFSNVTSAEMITQSKEYSSFLKVNTPHALLDTFQDHGVVYLLTFYFVEAVTGWYSFAFRILKAPVGLIGSAFYQLFYQKLSEAKNQNQDLQPLVLSMYKRLAIIGFPFFLVMFLFTPELFEWIFGNRWREAGEIAQILIPWLYLNFILSPVSSITLVCNRQKAAFKITIFDSSIRLIALVIGGVMQDYSLSFTLISIFCSILMIFGLWWYYSIAGTVVAVRNDQ
jgi:O-antigen/teichoic acid export membrane protein